MRRSIAICPVPALLLVGLVSAEPTEPPQVARATEPVQLEAPTKPTPAKAKKQRATKKQKKKKARRRAQPPSFDVTQTAAWRYGQMTREDCEAELTSRNVPFKTDEASGVMAAVRLTGPIRGITFRTRQSDEKRATSHWEIADCRLALALDDFAAILVTHDIVEVRHYSMYRSSRGGRPGSQHKGGLAIDAAKFTTSDGTVIDVLDDWHGRIGAKTCGDDAKPRVENEKSLKLRAILCEVAAQRIFNVILTPNHNRAHRNHFHLDVTPGAKWFIID